MSSPKCLLNIYSKLEKVHNNFMDEKDRVITEIYNESKERARYVPNIELTLNIV